jgi:hypothetical protein
MHPQQAVITHNKALISILIITHDTNRAVHLLNHELKAVITVPEPMNPVALAVISRVLQHFLAIPTTSTILAQEASRNTNFQALRMKNSITSITNKHVALLPQPVTNPTNLAFKTVPQEPVNQTELQRWVSAACMKGPCALFTCKQVIRLVYL